MKLYNNNIISFPKTGTRFLDEKLTYTGELNYVDLFTNEKYKDKPLYIIFRNPKDNLIGAINVALGYTPTLKETMENMLLNEDSHFNTNRFQMLNLYSKFNPNVTFVELNYLNNFLEHIVKISPFTKNNHRTDITVTEEDIINQEPYLWGLLEVIMRPEISLYHPLTRGKNTYIPIPTVNGVNDQVIINKSRTTSVTFSGNVEGTVYNWSNNNTAIGLEASGVGNIPSFVTTNNGSYTPISSTITITPTKTNGSVSCSGSLVTFTITVNPTIKSLI